MYPLKSSTCKTILALLFASLSTLAVAGTDKLCKTDIKALLKNYESALNNSDVQAVVNLYAKDGVFMPSTKPTSTGSKQVSTAYQYVFKNLDFDVKFHLNEIEWRKDLAFVRTYSDGLIKVINDDMTIKNNSRELFVMKRINGDWKIYRYMFNETGRAEAL